MADRERRLVRRDGAGGGTGAPGTTGNADWYAGTGPGAGPGRPGWFVVVVATSTKFVVVVTTAGRRFRGATSMIKRHIITYARFRAGFVPVWARGNEDMRCDGPGRAGGRRPGQSEAAGRGQAG
jgi:hypothetical protein